MMHTFRAWIDWAGSNEDRHHKACVRYARRCKHLRLLDIDRDRFPVCGCVARFVWRRHPVYVAVFVGRKYRRVLRLGRRDDRYEW